MVLVLTTKALPGSFPTRILCAVKTGLCCAVLLSSQVAHSQSGPGNSDDFQETLLNAERAIMEQLASEAVGASPVSASPADTLVEQPAVAEPAKAPAVKPQKPLAAQATKVAPIQKRKPAAAVKEPKLSPSDADIRVATISRENDKLRQEMNQLRERNAQLENELRDTRNQLSITETEVSRLSTMVDAKTRASLGRYNVPLPVKTQPVVEAPQPAEQPAPIKKVAEVKPPSPEAQLQIATVTVDKADLRLGPGKNNSALMTLRKGSRLAVEERQGEWYRVFAPNGERAWIHSSLVSFGDGASNLNDGSSVRVKGFSNNAEEEAFRRLQKMKQGR